MGDTTELEIRRPPSEDELRTILDRHRAWVESNGREGARADLSHVDLAGVSLDGVNLATAKLAGTNLAGAKLNGADLSGASLVRANLSGAELNLANLTAARLTDAKLIAAELCRTDLSGAYLERADLRRANLDHANLTAADLNEADLTGANLSHAELVRADLSRARLCEADLSHADLGRADLSRADLARVKLFDAVLVGANLAATDLRAADLTQANLSGASLHHADLGRARLKNTRLENADLRAARIQRLDQSFVRGAQFSALSSRWWLFICEMICGPLSLWFGKRGWKKAAKGVKFTSAHNDSWTVLRQSYAGPRVTFLFFTILVFALPYVGRAAMYSAVAPVEQQLAEQAAARKAILQARLDDGDSENEREINEEIRRLDMVLSKFEKKSVWKVLLNWDKGRRWPTILAGLLILYNIGIYGLITRVSALRDEEERSGWTPAWRDYSHLIWVHRVVVILFYVSVASFLINVGGMLGEEVLIPKFR
jgi:uncharacterized protein YjbI with pentapeptide repeats